MPQHSRIPAAQYLRMSTEHQQYSIDNQAAAIQKYAEDHDFEIVRTYSDPGKSGLVLKRRKGLQQLLADVVGGSSDYKAILVYDVSRWGRFQDCDESAHYEFLCKSAGTPIHYCAEQFVNDGGLTCLIFKALKRTLAAEYSRELGVKVYDGKRRLAARGFRQGGMAGYGLRRMLLDHEGKGKQKLASGEYKALSTDRVTLVRGPKREIQWVKRIYDIALRVGTNGIVRYLNAQGPRLPNGTPWTHQRVEDILTNPKYVGTNVWGRSSYKLSTRRLTTSPEQWVVKANSFPAVIDQATFDRVQDAIRNRQQRVTSEELLNFVRGLLAKHGKLTQRIIEYAGVHSISTYYRRFGPLRNVYKLVGYKAPTLAFVKSEHRAITLRHRDQVIKTIVELNTNRIAKIKVPGTIRPVLRIDDDLGISVLPCRSYVLKTSRAQRWELVPKYRERHCSLVLLCLFARDNDSFQSFYLMPSLDKKREYQIKGDADPWLHRGVKLKNLGEFYSQARQMLENVARTAA
ncbi:MAG: recombinase family protein [Terriglobales bacterium]